MKNKVTTNNLKEFNNFAKSMAERLLSKNEDSNKAAVMALAGELGAGKTTFAQTFAKTLGVEERVKSPTFAIFRKWKIESGKWKGKTFYHFDVYRIEDEKEILNLGWEEIISNPENIVLVEWADKIENILPKNAIWIKIKHLDKERREIVVE